MTPEHAHRSRGRRDGLTRIVSVAASFAAHLILLAVLAHVVVPPPVPRPERIPVDLVEIPAAPPLVAPVPAPPPRAAGGDRRPGSTTRRPAAPSRSAAGASSAALADEGIVAAPRERAVPDLRPRPSLMMATPGAGVEVVTPAPGARRAEAADGADGLRRWAAELAGRARVENGLAHPYHSDLARALAGNWDVERTVKARGLSGYLSEAGDNLKTFGRVWASMAEGYGRTGAPTVVDGGADRFRELGGLPPGPARDVLAQAEVRRQLRHAWSEGHVASVRVVQERDGRLKSVELVAPSKEAALDREALAAVPAAVASLPTPPEVLAGRDELITVWEFEIEVSITPPIPVVGLEFDEVLGGLDFRAPLDRRIWKRVRLVAIL
jgi:TonB family protein